MVGYSNAYTVVVTNSGALGVLAAGACAAAGLTLAPGYPVDVGAQARPKSFAAALAAAVVDREADAVVVRFETPDSPPGPVRRLPVADPGLHPAGPP